MCNLLQHYRDRHADAEQKVWDVQEQLPFSVPVQVVQEFQFEQLSALPEQFQLRLGHREAERALESACRRLHVVWCFGTDLLERARAASVSIRVMTLRGKLKAVGSADEACSKTRTHRRLV